jgi:hypothetical protein
VGAGEHGCIGVRARETDDLGLHLPERRQHHRFERAAQGERVSRAVHVLGGEREMHPFEHVGQARVPELELDEIFDRLHVVIGRGNAAMTLALELPDELCVVDRDPGQGAQQRLLVCRERTYPDAFGLREGREIFALDDDAHLHERIFAEIFRERFGRAAIAAVDGTYGGQRIEDHERAFRPVAARLPC